MTTVTDAELFADADRVRDKVVLITGAANGLGKSAALFFAKHGAKVVIGDLDIKGAEAVVAEIKSMGSDAVAQKCDVTSWEQQLSLFLLAISTFGKINIVVPNAGVTELGSFSGVRKEAVNGLPIKPDLKTIEVNLIAVLYTARLALYYLQENNQEELKSIVFVGSMASVESMPLAPLYSTSKHAIIGLMNSLHEEYKNDIRFAVICPWFADTAIVPTALKVFMAGIPLTPVSRVGGAIFRAATDRNSETNGAFWTLPDDGPVFRLDHGKLHLDQGVYKILNDRASSVLKLRPEVGGLRATFIALCKIIGGKGLVFLMSLIVTIFAWNNRAMWLS